MWWVDGWGESKPECTASSMYYISYNKIASKLSPQRLPPVLTCNIKHTCVDAAKN
jgi:hypothetical protein